MEAPGPTKYFMSLYISFKHATSIGLLQAWQSRGLGPDITKTAKKG